MKPLHPIRTPARFLFLAFGLMAAAAFASDGADRAKADLASRLKITADQIKIVKDQSVTWPNAALGLSRADEFVTQALVPGYIVELAFGGTSYLYHTGGKAVRFAGPTALLNRSLIYIEPAENEPNLNGNLVQTTVLGFNQRTLIPSVARYVSSPNGVILATRRTSRSGFELVYLGPNAGKSQSIAGAFDFGVMALDEAGKKWAALRRSTIGGVWDVAYGVVGSGEPTAADLPAGKEPKRLLWTDDTLYAQNDDAWYRFKGAWEKTDEPFAASDRSMVLDKSRTLEVATFTPDSDVVTNIQIVWFTGKREQVANIPGLAMTSRELVDRRWLLVAGKKGDKDAAYFVDVKTGLVMPSIQGKFSEAHVSVRPPTAVFMPAGVGSGYSNGR